MHESVMQYVESMLTKEIVLGARVLEIGAYNVNGSVRPYIQSLEPASYLGMDIQAGPSVDLVMDIKDLPESYDNRFDIVVCAEVFEHIEDWKAAIKRIKEITKPSGYILITTRSIGFPLHEYPADHWRYNKQDMTFIFSDCDILDLRNDPQVPGVFVFAQIPQDFPAIVDLSTYAIYSMEKQPETGSDCNIVIGIPTGGRSQQAAEVVKSWKKKGINVCITTWDDTYERERIIPLLEWEDGEDEFIVTDRMESFAVNQNRMMEHIPDWDVWICGADDLWPGGQYDLKDRIELVAGEAGNRLIWVADGCLNAQPTHPIITRAMYEAEGPKILCEDYEHNFVDTDLFSKMLLQKRVIKCFDIALDHRHPINQTADQDDIYAIGGKSYPQDAMLYHAKWGKEQITINDVEVVEIE